MSEHPLRKWRRQRGLSQEAAGEQLGYSRMTIFRWERRKRLPNRDQTADLNAKTGIPARELRPDFAELLA